MNQKLLLSLLVILVFIASSTLRNPIPIPLQIRKKLTSYEFIKTTKDFTQIVTKQDPAVALHQMRERIKTNDLLAGACHDILHEVGHAAFQKYRDFAKAMEYRDELCNSGYIHGIIEGYFSQTKDILSALKIICKDYPSGKYPGWGCYHGVGHALMFYTSNNLPKALELCTTYPSNFARSSCINGVFMENFTTEQLEHHTKYLKSDDLFYPCDSEQTDYKNDCYLYAPIQYLSLHPGGYSEALKWCKAVEKPFDTNCVEGVGMQALKDDINHPKLIEAICNDSSQTQACIAGMVALYINHYGSLEPARKLCPQLNPSNQSTCLLSIQANDSLFPNPSP